MDAQDLYDGLVLTGYPVAYAAFKTAQTPPFICYLFTGDASLKADNTNYFPAGDYQVELYLTKSDPTAEAAVQSQLDALGLPWARLPDAYLNTERILLVTYEMRLI